MRIVVATFGGGECLDFDQGLSHDIRQFADALQDGGEGIEVGLVVGSRVGEEIFGRQKVGEAFEELGEERPVDLAEKIGVGKEFKFGGIHKRPWSNPRGQVVVPRQGVGRSVWLAKCKMPESYSRGFESTICAGGRWDHRPADQGKRGPSV